MIIIGIVVSVILLLVLAVVVINDVVATYKSRGPDNGSDEFLE